MAVSSFALVAMHMVRAKSASSHTPEDYGVSVVAQKQIPQ